ncbi:MAG TPA: 50S ribosomal protein L21 [Candidatus Magasanikbacteria bacterium]|nr:50S ribosomal protein L21 [Candidatus Magasanikbacteria bacterium]
MFAVIQTGGKQYLVQEGQTIKIEKIEGEKGAKVKFEEVLLLASEDGTGVEMGKPFLTAKVEGEVLEQGRSPKVRVIKFKRKVRYNRRHGHRQAYTRIKITKIA